MLQMQQQWIQMLTGGAGSSELAKKVADLEQQVAAQAQLLELMKARLNIETAEQEEDFTRKFKELIERQNQQFEQLTSSFSDFFKKQGTAEEKDEKK
jgi:predicted RNA-binding protein with RPS1 domain